MTQLILFTFIMFPPFMSPPFKGWETYCFSPCVCVSVGLCVCGSVCLSVRHKIVSAL